MRYGDGKREYTVTDGLADYSVITGEHIQHGAIIHAEGEAEGSRIIAGKITILSGEKAAATLARVRQNIAGSSGMPDSPTLLKDDVSAGIWPLMRKAALLILEARKLGRSVQLRFHGDADGISGALALTKAVRCKSFQQNSAAYSVRDALRDISAIGQENMPLVILLDFGSGENCSEGLSLLRAAGIEYLVIDHHPMDARGTRRMPAS